MKKITISHFRRLKNSSESFAALTAYDYTSARLVDAAGIPLILVGDSAANVIFGYETTLPVSMDQMIILCAAVARGVQSGLVIGDMPFMSYQPSVSEAVSAAGRFMKEGRTDGVKLEGGTHMCGQISAITQCGIPVMGHVGLTPQSFHQMSGYRIQGKKLSDARQILDDALAVEDAGAFAVVLEGVPAELAQMITEKLTIPTIGIAAGPYCDGQIQVFHDILGLDPDFTPKHTRKYSSLAENITQSIQRYQDDVRNRTFPDSNHYTIMDSSVLQKLQKQDDRL